MPIFLRRWIVSNIILALLVWYIYNFKSLCAGAYALTVSEIDCGTIGQVNTSEIPDITLQVSQFWIQACTWGFSDLPPVALQPGENRHCKQRTTSCCLLKPRRESLARNFSSSTFWVIHLFISEQICETVCIKENFSLL